ncbi:putative ribonuclease H domain, reverse transcriptase zinc-binding domain-containing protein [Arabidopsis thaliana]
MSCFQLPQDLCKKLTSVMTEFWWSSGNDRNKIPWVAWKKLCKKKEDGGLGFHDIVKFNQALLCKQAWRLLDQPQSLLARFLKSRYFKKKSFLDCGVGTRPSYAWRSIIHGRELLKKGLRKSIGNGQNTWVWIEKWIPDDYPRPPTSLQRNRDVMLRVSDLLDRNTGHWDEDRVRHLFIREDADYILSLRVSTDLQDSYVWSFSKNGLYNSQSGYKLLEALPEHQEFPITSLPPIEKKLWSRLWKVQTMPKIRHFMWKALAGALAVSDRLQSRGIHIDLTCKMCGKETETICHVLFHCHVAKQSWGLSNIPAPEMGFSKNSVFLNLFHLLNRAERRDSLTNNTQVFPWLLWHIWKSRNSFVFEGKRYDANSILVKAREDAETWMAANKSDAPATNTSLSTSSHTHHTWRSPMLSFGKCNIGCSWIKQEMNCGAAWILRDHSGKPLFHSRRSYSKIASRFEADLLSLLWAVESLSNLRQNKIIFEISSQKVVEAMRYPHRYPLFRHLISDIRRFLDAFEFSVIVNSATECNRVANEIATSFTRDHRYQSYVAREGPLWLREIIIEESKLLV